MKMKKLKDLIIKELGGYTESDLFQEVSCKPQVISPFDFETLSFSSSISLDEFEALGEERLTKMMKKYLIQELAFGIEPHVKFDVIKPQYGAFPEVVFTAKINVSKDIWE